MNPKETEDRERLEKMTLKELRTIGKRRVPCN